MLDSFAYVMPTRIVFGAGALDGLAEQVASLGVRPFVVTGQGSAQASGALDRVRAMLPGAVVFEGIAPDPGDVQCEAAAAACRDAQCDVVVALGGGSAMDAAKAAAVLAVNDGRCTDYLRGRAVGRALPLVAVPTTAGTGSEVTPYAVITDTAERAKRTIKGAALFPSVALLDPELTRTMPRSVAVHTGLDALSQAMEGMVSRRATALGDVLALDAIRRLRRWLPIAADDPERLDARGEVLFASMLSGCVIAQSGTTLVHGMGYCFTLECGVPHGLANALLLTPLFQYNARQVQRPVVRIAEALGAQPPNPGGPSWPPAAKEALAECIGGAIHGFLAELGISPVAAEAGVDPSRIDAFTETVCAAPYRFRNQPGAPTREQVRAFYAQSCGGTR